MKKINLRQEAKQYKNDLSDKMRNKYFKSAYDTELKILSLAKEVEKIRKDKQISQVEIAHSLGVNQQQISRFEQGRQNATLNSFLKMLSVLDKDIIIVDKSKNQQKLQPKRKVRSK